MPTHQVAVVGPSVHTRPLETALRRAGLQPEPILPSTALRSPGMTQAAALTIFTATPGTHAPLEAEVYAAGQGALHVFWDAGTALVGPYVAPRHGPCPNCLALAAGPMGSGRHRALVGWASSLAALQAHAIVRGSTDLVGVSWVWGFARPGLGLIPWAPAPGCTAPGCTAPCSAQP